MGVFCDHVLIDLWPGLHRFLERHATLRGAAKVLAYGALLFVAALVYATYENLDDHGWIPHNHDTPVWVRGEWLVGEYRSCDMPVRTTRLFCASDTTAGSSIVGFTNSVSDDDAANALNAAMSRNARTDWTPLDKYFHVLPVRYYGRLVRPERDTERGILTWRCQRNNDSLTCKALD